MIALELNVYTTNTWLELHMDMSQVYVASRTIAGHNLNANRIGNVQQMPSRLAVKWESRRLEATLAYGRGLREHT